MVAESCWMWPALIIWSIKLATALPFMACYSRTCIRALMEASSSSCCRVASSFLISSSLSSSICLLVLRRFEPTCIMLAETPLVTKDEMEDESSND